MNRFLLAQIEEKEKQKAIQRANTEKERLEHASNQALIKMETSDAISRQRDRIAKYRSDLDNQRLGRRETPLMSETEKRINKNVLEKAYKSKISN